MNPYIELYTQLIQYQRVNTGSFNFALLTYCPKANRSDVYVIKNFKRLMTLNDGLKTNELNHAANLLKDNLVNQPDMVHLYTNSRFGADDWLQIHSKPLIDQLEYFKALPVDSQLLINESYDDKVAALIERMI